LGIQDSLNRDGMCDPCANWITAIPLNFQPTPAIRPKAANHRGFRGGPRQRSGSAYQASRRLGSRVTARSTTIICLARSQLQFFIHSGPMTTLLKLAKASAGALPTAGYHGRRERAERESPPMATGFLRFANASGHRSMHSQRGATSRDERAKYWTAQIVAPKPVGRAHRPPDIESIAPTGLLGGDRKNTLGQQVRMLGRSCKAALPSESRILARPQGRPPTRLTDPRFDTMSQRGGLNRLDIFKPRSDPAGQGPGLGSDRNPNTSRGRCDPRSGMIVRLAAAAPPPPLACSMPRAGKKRA